MQFALKTSALLVVAGLAFVAIRPACAAEETATYTIEAKDGAFTPAELAVPAGQKIHLLIKNNDSTGVEFESYRLRQEIRIAPGQSDEAYVGPLDAGSYDFFDDNNPDAKGQITVR